jgi:hypothetical protein
LTRVVLLFVPFNSDALVLQSLCYYVRTFGGARRELFFLCKKGYDDLRMLRRGNGGG